MSAVDLLAYTVAPAAYDLVPEQWVTAGDIETSDADQLAEIAGRECYQSFDKPNPATAENADYLANIIRQQHTSVLAHASFTFRFTDVSRSLTHELIRSRFLAFSELSQRYVNMSDSYTVVPPRFQGEDNPGRYRFNQIAREVIDRHHSRAVEVYEELVSLAELSGATRKQARQAARCVLPGGTETRIVVSGNVRAWRDFVNQRFTVHADDEIREVAGKVLAIIREYAPASVQDIPETPYA